MYSYPKIIQLCIWCIALIGWFSSMSAKFVFNSFITVRRVVTGNIWAYAYTWTLLKGNKTFIWIKRNYMSSKIHFLVLDLLRRLTLYLYTFWWYNQNQLRWFITKRVILYAWERRTIFKTCHTIYKWITLEIVFLLFLNIFGSISFHRVIRFWRYLKYSWFWLLSFSWFIECSSVNLSLHHGTHRSFSQN